MSDGRATPVPGSPEWRADEVIGMHVRRERLQEDWRADIADAIRYAVRDAVLAERGRCADVVFRARAGLPAADPAVDLLCEVESDVRGGPAPP